jgi:mono/diheme cytochrome c family protein
MKKNLHTLAWVVLMSAGVAVARAGAADEPATGKVLVLDNEHTLEGNIERVGTQYRVRRIVGETWVSGERVLRLCADQESAYLFLRGRANLNDADERLRLADWCRQHGLRAQAIAEVQEAVQLRPQNVASRRLLDHLRQLDLTAEVAAKSAQEPDAPAPVVDLTADSMGLFATRVTPILMNTCAGCHAADKGGKFKLTRSYESEGLNRKVIQQNLAAVLAQVNLHDPRVSPLLTKAVSVHGPLAQAPLRSRQSPAYRTLEDWVRLTLANNPGIHDLATATPADGHASAPAKNSAGFAADGSPADEPSPTPTPAAAPAKPAAPDPFDPADFNRQVRPDSKPEEPKKP